MEKIINCIHRIQNLRKSISYGSGSGYGSGYGTTAIFQAISL